MLETDTPGHTKEMDAEDQLSRARELVAEAVGDIMSFWNFRPSTGRVWACIYLSPRPLTAAEIVEHTGLSVGSVSMTLQELRRWGVAHESGRSSGRRCFEAETDVVKMVTPIRQNRKVTLEKSPYEKSN